MERGKSTRGEGPEPDLSTTEAYEALAGSSPLTCVLVLYVAGTAPRSLRAIRHTRRLCEEYLAGYHDLEIVDIYQQPGLAEVDSILAVPVLVKKQPPPEQRFVGDMTDIRRVLAGLGLPPEAVRGGSG